MQEEMEHNLTNRSLQKIFSTEEQIIVYVSYTAVTLLGILFNSIVCYLIIKHRYLRTVVNLLILNLAISDIISCLSIYPFVYLKISDTSIRGRYADIMCGLNEGLFVFFTSATVSLITLSVLSISRYLGINHPLKVTWRLNRRKIQFIMIISWLMSMCLLIPNSLSFKYDDGLRLCIRDWAKGVDPLVYFAFTGVLGVLIPLSSLTFTYVTSFYTLWIKVPVENEIKSKRGLLVKRRVVKLLGVLIVVYLICWSPFACYWLLSVVIGEYTIGNYDDERLSIRTIRLTIFFAVMNTVLNPIVYSFTSSQLRATLRRQWTDFTSLQNSGKNVRVNNRTKSFTNDYMQQARKRCNTNLSYASSENSCVYQTEIYSSSFM